MLRALASRDAARVCTVDANGTIQVWDMEQGAILLRLALNGRESNLAGGEPKRTVPCSGLPRTAFLSPDGKRLVLQINTVGPQVFDVDSGEATLVVTTSGVLASADFSGGERLAVALSDNIARVWRADRQEPIGPPLRHPTFVRHVALSPEGVRAATYCADGYLRIWNGERGDLLLARKVTRPPGQPANVRIVHIWFSAGGQRLCLLWADGTSRQWPLPTCRVPADLTPEFVRLLTGLEIDETDGIAFVPEKTFIENRERYRRAWLAWRVRLSRNDE
jgi:WD40 repeat protein